MKQDDLDRLIRDTFPERKKKHTPQRPPSSQITVELAVQHHWGGNRFTFTHTTKTISRFEAEQAARKAAAEQKLEVWWVNDIYEGLPKKD